MALKRGEVWTLSGGVYASKLRPAVILQSDLFSETASVTVVPSTPDPTEAPLFRLPVEPTMENGFRTVSSLMVDKITTVPRTNLGQCIGRLSEDDLVRVNRA